MSNNQGGGDPPVDQNFVQKMQYISLNDQGEPDPRYGRIMGKPEPVNAVYQHRPIVAGDGFSREGTVQPQKNNYRLYERENIIASSKYATPKQMENITAPRVEENDVYVQCAKPQVPLPTSPTHSHSGSSHHSGSPRASVAVNNAPLYENIDYYAGRSSMPPYYHQLQGVNKAQPQVPISNKLVGSSREDPLPVYENVLEYSHKATPGPQVAAGQAPPPYQNYSQPQQQPVYSIMHSPRNVIQNSPKTAPAPYYHQLPKSPSKSLTQQQLDEINGSDYVCMTGNVSQTLSTNTQFQTSTAKNYARAPATGIAGAPTIPPKESKKAVQADKAEGRNQNAPSPTPSATSISSGRLRFSGKTLLPYHITPPRPRGPSEAEKKVEEMTRQIEEEMEKLEEEGEYFGM